MNQSLFDLHHTRLGLLTISTSRDGSERVGGERSYRVRIFVSDDPAVITPEGTGFAYDVVSEFINFEGVRNVALMGHSWGGGAVYALAAHAQQTGLINNTTRRLDYTAYVDAIRVQNKAGRAEFRAPPLSRWKENYYQRNFFSLLKGESIQGCDINQIVSNVFHSTIDNSQVVHDAIVEHLQIRMPLETIQ